MDVPENAKIALGFWVGYMSDFFYGWIPKYIKTFINKEPNFNNNERSNQKVEPNTDSVMGGDNDPLRDSDCPGGVR